MKSNIFIYISSFIIAVILWLYINLNLFYTITFNVPAEIKVSKIQGITGDVPSSIDITAKGKGWDLLTMTVTKNLIYSLDLSGSKKETKINVAQNIGEVLNIPAGVTILNVSPDYFEISFDNITSRMVKVRNNLNVILKEGYSIIGNPLVSPDSVKITGANSVINKIKSLSTEYQKIDNANSYFTKELKLIDTLSNAIRIDPKSVRISYRIELLAEKTFNDIDVMIFNLPADKEVLLIPPKIKLFVRGGVEQLSRINIPDIIAGIEYKQIENDELGYIIPKISLPNDAMLVKFEPDRFQYIIKKKNN